MVYIDPATQRPGIRTGEHIGCSRGPYGRSGHGRRLHGRIRVTWNVASGATAYEVWRNSSNDSSTATKVSAQDVIGTSFDDTSATVGVTYWYWVKAKNAVGPSGFSASDQGRRADHVDAPVITSVSPDSLPAVPLGQLQPLTIHGSGFSPASSLRFVVSGVSQYNSDPARLTFVDSTQLRYNISVGPDPADWTVTVINGTAESNAMPFTVTAAGDTVAPAAPITPTAEFVGKFTHNLFYVNWVNPADPSGLSKIWWKLGSPPTSDTDGIGLDLPLFQPLPMVSDTQQTLYLWLEDGAGNKDYRNNAAVVLTPTTYEFPEIESNDTLATATALTPWENPAGGGYSYAFGLGAINPATDVDYWSIETVGRGRGERGGGHAGQQPEPAGLAAQRGGWDAGRQLSGHRSRSRRVDLAVCNQQHGDLLRPRGRRKLDIRRIRNGDLPNPRRRCARRSTRKRHQLRQ